MIKFTRSTALKLHPVKGKQRYCGPSAISAIANCTTDDAALLIRVLTGRKMVTGTSAREIGTALMALGFDIGWGRRERSKPTLAKWLKTHSRKPSEMYLINCGNHWQVIKGSRIICGILKTPRSFKDPEVKRRATVREYWTVRKTDPNMDQIGLAERTRKGMTDAQRKRNKVKSQIRALCKEHSITVEVEKIDDDFYHHYVYAPEHIEEHPSYPYWDNHIVHDDAEVLDRIKDILHFMRLSKEEKKNLYS